MPCAVWAGPDGISDGSAVGEQQGEQRCAVERGVLLRLLFLLFLSAEQRTEQTAALIEQQQTFAESLAEGFW